MKLVSEVGVGTVAAGVAKAKADHVTIAGHDGGTGASPLSSIKHAGTPWELGLAETQQTLVLNRLRGRIAVQVDGQMKTGRDVVIGALLGADEFGFATAPLVVEGCIMMRKCHLNTCPVGVATQDPGAAQEVHRPARARRQLLLLRRRGSARDDGAARLPHVRRADRPRRPARHARAASSTGRRRGSTSRASSTSRRCRAEVARHHCEEQDHGLDERARPPADRGGAQPALEQAAAGAARRTGSATRNRTVGAMLSGEVARRYGHAGLPDDTIHVAFDGHRRPELRRVPRARHHASSCRATTNDYVGKGLSGGRIVVYPGSRRVPAKPEENIIIGNTVMYGAIAGEAYFRGVAGERFCVRNSGATAVVEGMGDHGCEYMTGGTVVVLGRDRAQLRRRHVAAASPTSTTRTARSRSAATRRWSRWSRC